MQTWTIEADGSFFTITDAGGSVRAKGHAIEIARRLAVLLADCEETLTIGRDFANAIKRIQPNELIREDHVRQLTMSADLFVARIGEHAVGKAANGA
ncbi:MAG: hypothetical protein L0Z53_13070 [Acidobacteriales bacterium]|nr:hypothetical protein [Terriglobales bacterium]